MSTPLHKDIILQKLTAKKLELFEFGVEQIGLFGSYLTNNATSDSDIDLLVEITPSHKTFRNFLALNYFLEDLFGCKVDLVTKQSLSPYIGPHILKTVEYASLAS